MELEKEVEVTSQPSSVLAEGLRSVQQVASPSQERQESRASSPGLEYTKDSPTSTGLTTFLRAQEDPLWCVSADVVEEWMKNAPNGRPVDFRAAPLDMNLSDEESFQGRAGVGSLSDEAHNLQEHLDEEDAEVDGLIETHVKPPLSLCLEAGCLITSGS